jgi:hypothetical protein
VGASRSLAAGIEGEPITLKPLRPPCKIASGTDQTCCFAAVLSPFDYVHLPITREGGRLCPRKLFRTQEG